MTSLGDKNQEPEFLKVKGGGGRGASGRSRNLFRRRLRKVIKSEVKAGALS